MEVTLVHSRLTRWYDAPGGATRVHIVFGKCISNLDLYFQLYSVQAESLILHIIVVDPGAAKKQIMMLPRVSIQLG